MPDAHDVLDAVRTFARTGQYPGGIDRLKADIIPLAGTQEGEEIIALLQSLGADEGGSTPLNMEDHYVAGDTRFERRWPLGVALPLPFEELDHKTQFFVLFAEWTRREMEGGYALNNGDPAGAKATFEECLERARQLGVGELLARSHEGLARVASVTNDRTNERNHLKQAVAARQGT